MLKNFDVFNDPLFKKIRSKEQPGFPPGLGRSGTCGQGLKLTGLSNSGG